VPGTAARNPDPKTVERDFAHIAAKGMNTVRTYDVPPRWLLDLAERQGLHVVVGLRAFMGTEQDQ